MTKAVLRALKSYGFYIMMFGVLFFCKELFCQHEELVFSDTMWEKSSLIYDIRDVSDEDKALQEAYALSLDIYKKMVELIALYYCKSIIIDAQIMYDKILIDTCGDALNMIKLLAQYVPLVCKNKKTSWITKTKKLTGVGCVVTLSVVWLRTFCHNLAQKKTTSEIK